MGKIHIESNSNLKDVVNMLNCLGFNFEYTEKEVEHGR